MIISGVYRREYEGENICTEGQGNHPATLLTCSGYRTGSCKMITYSGELKDSLVVDCFTRLFLVKGFDLQAKRWLGHLLAYLRTFILT